MYIIYLKNLKKHGSLALNLPIDNQKIVTD